MPINVEVKPRKNESPEAMIKRFIKKVKKEGIVDEWRNRCMYYEKPSVGRRLKKIYKKKLARKAQKAYDDKYKD
jgi:ribosomal protein S21